MGRFAAVCKTKTGSGGVSGNNQGVVENESLKLKNMQKKFLWRKVMMMRYWDVLQLRSL